MADSKKGHPDREPNRIEDLKKRLYSRSQSQSVDGIKRSKLSEREHDIPTDWKGSHRGFDTENMPRKKKTSLLNKLLIFAALFFVVALGFAFFAIQSNFNSISSEKIDIIASGPTSIPAGDVLTLNITVRNRNDVPLEGARLLVEFPEGTRNPDDLSEELTRTQKELGNIASGRKQETTIESVLFGSEGDVKKITLGVEYRVPDSSALFYTESIHGIEISSSPLTLSVQGPEEVKSGQVAEFRVEVKANTTETIENVLLVAGYPFGFEFIDAVPKDTFDSNIWLIGDVAPGSSYVVRIRGRISGQQDEERTLRFTLGLQSRDNEKVVGTPFLTYQESVVLQKPAVNLSFLLDGTIGDEFVVEDMERTLRADVSWENNLASKLQNALIRVEFDGSLIDQNSISISGGAYRPDADTIVWDSRSSPGLQIVSSGQSGNVTFSFRPKGVSLLAGAVQEPTLPVTITMQGNTPDRQSSAVNTSTTKKILFMTKLALDQNITHIGGAFPPQVNEETEYEVRWSISNAFNHVSGARVQATLPSYVQWAGADNSSNEDVTFNSVGGQVRWNVGDVQAGTGFSRQAREAVFRIKISPSAAQAGQQPTLISESVLEGTDTFVERRVGDTATPQTTGAVVGG